MIGSLSPFQSGATPTLAIEIADADEEAKDKPPPPAATRADPLLGIQPLLSPDDIGRLVERQGRTPIAEARPKGETTGTQLRRRPELSANGRPNLSREEAINLAMPGAKPVDLNHDGFTPSFGGAKVWRFPPPAADVAVQRAWEEATANLDEAATADLADRFTSMNLMVNMGTDSQGELMTRDPGDPGWRDLFSEPGFSYASATKSLIAANEAGKAFAAPEAYERNHDMLEQLASSFGQHGVG